MPANQRNARARIMGQEEPQASSRTGQAPLPCNLDGSMPVCERCRVDDAPSPCDLHDSMPVCESCRWSLGQCSSAQICSRIFISKSYHFCLEIRSVLTAEVNGSRGPTSVLKRCILSRIFISISCHFWARDQIGTHRCN